MIATGHHSAIALLLGVGLAATGFEAHASPRGDTPPSFRVPLNKRQASAIGSPTNGRLNKGVALPKQGRGFRRIHAKRFFGTDETIALLEYTGARLDRAYPGTEPLLVGAIAKKGGGKSGTHRSHQNGIDVDWAYLEKGNPQRRYYKSNVRADELDYEKNWFLFETVILTGRVSYIFVDRSMLKRLYRAARDAGWSRKALKPIFGNGHFKGANRIIRHWPGHTYHAHLRFRCSQGAVRCEDGRYR